MAYKIPLSQYILGLLVIIYLLLSIYLFFMQVGFEDLIRIHGISRRKNYHAILVLVGMCLLGFGMMLFRLFRGARTRIIKYVHLIVQGAALICFIFGYVSALRYGLAYKDITPWSNPNNTYPFEEKPDDFDEFLRIMEELATHISGSTHTVLGYMMLVSILLQFIVAVILMAYMYPKSKLRRNFAPFHDIFGIWIYLGLVCTYLTGIFYLHDQQIECCTISDNTKSSLNKLAPPVYFCSIIVFCAVLSPYFEWDLIGPL